MNKQKGNAQFKINLKHKLDIVFRFTPNSLFHYNVFFFLGFLCLCRSIWLKEVIFEREHWTCETNFMVL